MGTVCILLGHSVGSFVLGNRKIITLLTGSKPTGLEGIQQAEILYFQDIMIFMIPLSYKSSWLMILLIVASGKEKQLLWV